MSVSTAVEVRKEAEQLAQSIRNTQIFMRELVKLLHTRMLKYNWVGFYMLEKSPADEPMLVLGPFEGATTPHTRIRLNQGLCGAAASTGKTVVVDDVAEDPRYLACSTDTKSEIVVPVFVRGKVAGELDIDSHFPAAFKEDDRELVEYCAVLTGRHLEQTAG
jgi:GAF domain-containing protein